MPIRLPAIPDDVLRRELESLPDSTRLLPKQVIMVIGLSASQLKERNRLDPPKPPHPLPREKGHPGLWFSLGSLRAYLASIEEQANIDSALGRRPFERKLRFSAWLGSPHLTTQWPFALVGPQKRPVDLWATIRGEVPMRRTDSTAWLTVDAYLSARLAAAEAEERAREMAVLKAEAKERRATALEVRPSRSKGTRKYS
jgi:hypothetical protein